MMCRVLAYLGTPILVDDLLYKMDSSLLKQAYAPQMLHMLNLAGFGLSAWDRRSYDPDTPYSYQTTSVPVFDTNLKSLASKLRADCLIAHVRGVAYSHTVQISQQNLHPFRYSGIPLCLAHNGDLARFDEMKYELLRFIKPRIASCIKGTTDSEWIYALLLSQFEDPSLHQSTRDLVRGVHETLTIIREVRERLGIGESSSANLFISDGRNLLTTRFTYDFGCYADAVHEANLSYLSLWYTTGSAYGWHDEQWKMIGGAVNADSVIISSEPLTQDISTWLEVPEYTLIYVSETNRRRQVRLVELDV